MHALGAVSAFEAEPSGAVAGRGDRASHAPDRAALETRLALAWPARRRAAGARRSSASPARDWLAENQARLSADRGRPLFHPRLASAQTRCRPGRIGLADRRRHRLRHRRARDRRAAASWRSTRWRVAGGFAACSTWAPAPASSRSPRPRPGAAGVGAATSIPKRCGSRAATPRRTASRRCWRRRVRAPAIASARCTGARPYDLVLRQHPGAAA